MSQETKQLRLNLACGDIKMEGFIGVDIAKTENCDEVMDLKVFPWKWEDNSVDEIWCSHFFEHLTGAERIRFMEECYRIMKDGAKMTIICPYYTSMRAIQDPTHQWPPVAESSFLYFNKQWMKDNKLEHYNINADFDFNYGYSMSPEIISKHQDVQAFAVKNYNNSVNDLQVSLTKKEKL